MSDRPDRESRSINFRIRLTNLWVETGWGPPSGAGKCLFCLGEREKQNKRCKHAITCAHGRSYVKRSLFRFCFLRNIVLQILQVLRYEYVRGCGSLSVSAVWVFRTGREGFRRSRRAVPSESLKYLRLQPVPILQISRTSVIRRAAGFEENTPASRTFPRCICFWSCWSDGQPPIERLRVNKYACDNETLALLLLIYMRNSAKVRLCASCGPVL